jgi:hypothetical protein
MKNPKVQNLRSLRVELKAVARGERPALAVLAEDRLTCDRSFPA